MGHSQLSGKHQLELNRKCRHRIRTHLGPWDYLWHMLGAWNNSLSQSVSPQPPCPWGPARGHPDHFLSLLQPRLSLIPPQPHSPPHLHLEILFLRAPAPGAPSPKPFPELPIGLFTVLGGPQLPVPFSQPHCTLRCVFAKTSSSSSATCSASTDRGHGMCPARFQVLKTQ